MSPLVCIIAGPGAYEPKTKDRRGNMMITKDKRFHAQKSEMPGPGAYEVSYAGLNSLKSSWVSSIINIHVFVTSSWKNPAYGGATRVFLDQLFPYVYIHRLFSTLSESKKSVYCRITPIRQKFKALIRCRASCAASDQSLVFFFLHKPGFHRWRHIFYNNFYINIPRTVTVDSVWWRI